MRLLGLLLATGVVLTLPRTAPGDPPAPPKADRAPPVGKWTVEFANGVFEKVEIKKDGTATVTEPARTSDGKVTATQDTYLFVCEDGRIDRWTPVGKWMVVEHWASLDQTANGPPVRGIADITD
jgi:hypothetical protein